MLPGHLYAQLRRHRVVQAQGQGRLHVHQIGRGQQAGLAEVGRFREQRIEGPQAAVTRIAIATGDVGLQPQTRLQRQLRPAPTGIGSQRPGANVEVAGRGAQFTALRHQLAVPVQCTGLAEPARTQGLPPLDAGTRREACAFAAVVQQIQIPLPRALPACRGGIGTPQVGTVLPAIIKGTRPVLHRSQCHQIKRAEAALPAQARTIEGQADVRPIAHRQQS